MFKNLSISLYNRDLEKKIRLFLYSLTNDEIFIILKIDEDVVA